MCIGIQPDILSCRSDRAVPGNERARLASFWHVPANAVISMKALFPIHTIAGLFNFQGRYE
ncbi:hypothetical protein [Salmonella enterica]|uniref:hypothetical protein n=1 Tax=Salmonella enterica TaxID=28901 RepID=UPI00398C5DB3